jgi:hypothetical protein
LSEKEKQKQKGNASYFKYKALILPI